MVTNQQIREAAKSPGIKLWEIAAKIGITDSNFSRKLRKELSQEETARILSIIRDLATEKMEVS